MDDVNSVIDILSWSCKIFVYVLSFLFALKFLF